MIRLQKIALKQGTGSCVPPVARDVGCVPALRRRVGDNAGGENQHHWAGEEGAAGAGGAGTGSAGVGATGVGAAGAGAAGAGAVPAGGTTTGGGTGLGKVSCHSCNANPGPTPPISLRSSWQR